jgi:hypothetical protein
MQALDGQSELSMQVVEIEPGASCVLIPGFDDPLVFASFDSRTIDLAGPRNTRYANANAGKYSIGGQGTSVLLFSLKFDSRTFDLAGLIKSKSFVEANARRYVYSCSPKN